jgi:protein MpaA
MRADRPRLRWWAGPAACALLMPLALSVPTYGQAPGRPAVIGQRVIGHSVNDRPIRAWHLGDPDAGRTVVALATMHGNEPAPRHTLARLRDGAPISGVDLWVVPNANPDGLARNSRYNANGIDINRNFPVRWVPGPHHGPRPASAPETRALMHFARDIDPHRIVSFHQPLFGVDTLGSKSPRFARRLAEEFRLPRKRFDCGGGCHGTMTQWFNRRFAGAQVTIEYGASPSPRYVNRLGPRALLRAIGGSR